MTPIVAPALLLAAVCGGKWLRGKVQEMGLGCAAARGWADVPHALSAHWEDGGGHVHFAHNQTQIRL